MFNVRTPSFPTRRSSYLHIWNGGYAVAIKGAYCAAGLAKAKEEHRIGHVAADPLLTLRIHCDIGGTGANSDAFVMWANQYIGKEVRCLNPYEAVGQPIEAHAKWLRDNDILPKKRSEEHTSELQSLMSMPYAVFRLQHKKT